MKTFTYTALVACIFLLNACKKESERSGPFKETTYEKLGSFDQNGLPDYLETPDIISPSLRTFIDIYMKDSRNLTLSNPELFTNNAIADIKLVKSASVYMTFVHQNTDGNSAIGFYNYPTNNPPKTAKDIQTITYAFPNAGGNTPLKAGDKVKLGTFQQGTSVGFVLMVGAWRSDTKSINPNAIHYCSNDVLNPESTPALKKHAVLIDYPSENKVLIGFEDQNRENPACDNDFNDAVFYCTIKY